MPLQHMLSQNKLLSKMAEQRAGAAQQKQKQQQQQQQQQQPKGPVAQVKKFFRGLFGHRADKDQPADRTAEQSASGSSGKSPELSTKDAATLDGSMWLHQSRPDETSSIKQSQLSKQQPQKQQNYKRTTPQAMEISKLPSDSELDDLKRVVKFRPSSEDEPVNFDKTLNCLNKDANILLFGAKAGIFDNGGDKMGTINAAANITKSVQRIRRLAERDAGLGPIQRNNGYQQTDTELFATSQRPIGNLRLNSMAYRGSSPDAWRRDPAGAKTKIENSLRLLEFDTSLVDKSRRWRKLAISFNCTEPRPPARCLAVWEAAKRVAQRHRNLIRRREILNEIENFVQAAEEKRRLDARVCADAKLWAITRKLTNMVPRRKKFRRLRRRGRMRRRTKRSKRSDELDEIDNDLDNIDNETEGEESELQSVEDFAW